MKNETSMKQYRRNRTAQARRLDKWFAGVEKRHAEAIARIRPDLVYSNSLGRFVSIPK